MNELDMTSSRQNDSHNNGNGRKRRSPYCLVVLTSLLSGGGASLILPFMAPGFVKEAYRTDPAYGSEVSELRAEIRALNNVVQEFLIKGPDEVRGALDDINDKLEAIGEIIIRHDERAKTRRDDS